MRNEVIERIENEIKERLELLEVIEEERAKKIKDSSEYKTFIESKEWQETRTRIFKRDKYKCQICGSCKNLQVHHITYENLGQEKDADLVTLCEKCHIEDIHKDKSKPNNNNHNISSQLDEVIENYLNLFANEKQKVLREYYKKIIWLLSFLSGVIDECMHEDYKTYNQLKKIWKDGLPACFSNTDSDLTKDYNFDALPPEDDIPEDDFPKGF